MKTKEISIYLLITILCILISYVIIKYAISDNVAPFVSEYDSRNYDIRNSGNLQVKQTAADYLAFLNHKITILVDYMFQKNLPDKDTANRLYNRWNVIKLKETSSLEKSAAFTLNKNVEIRICIRDNKGNFENPNTSMFVILHELSHVMSIGYGHDEEFKNNFDYITHLASQLGLYKPENFGLYPKTYCGVEINTTPCDKGTCEYGTKTNEILSNS